MSSQALKIIQFSTVCISLVMGTTGLCIAAFSIPDRVTKVEKEVKLLHESREKDHELLIRIEERIKTIQQTLKP